MESSGVKRQLKWIEQETDWVSISLLLKTLKSLRDTQQSARVISISIDGNWWILREKAMGNERTIEINKEMTC